MGKRNVNSSALWGVVIGVLMALIASVVMALIFASILNRSGAGESTRNIMAVAIWIISIIIGNAVLSYFIKEKRMIWIIVVGIVYFAVLLASQILLFNGVFSGLWKGLLSVAGGILLSVLLFGREKSHKKRKVRYRPK